jgi:hypothetical protein
MTAIPAMTGGEILSLVDRYVDFTPDCPLKVAVWWRELKSGR